MSKDDQVLKFDDLNLTIGQTIQIHPNTDIAHERFDCLLVGCLPGESVIVTAPPETGHFPEVSEGQRVVIRVLSANGVALFPTTVLFVAEVPVFMVYLDFPQAIKFKLVRTASRVEVALPVLVANLSGKKISGEPGKISDISIGGARIELAIDVGDIGDQLELKGKFKVGDITRILVLLASIVKKKPSEKGFIYGVSFLEADEEKLLILFGYIFNSMAFGRVQVIS